MPLPPREADLLSALIAQPGAIVFREELLANVWGSLGRTSADARLNSCIRRLRAALGDDARAPEYVETIHKRGYRFICPVSWTSEAAPDTRGASLVTRRVTPNGLVWLAAATAVAWILMSETRPADSRRPPPGLETQYLRGRELATRGDPAGAREGSMLLRQVATEAPVLAGVWSGLATASAILGRLRDADRYAQRALAIDTASAEAHRALAETAIGLRWDLYEAENHVLHAIALDPRYPLARSTYAYILGVQGRWDAAVQEARVGLTLDPTRALLAGDLAFFLYWAGRNDEAIDQAERALAIQPDMPGALAALRLAHLSKGDTVAADPPTRRLVQLLSRVEGRGSPAEASGADLQSHYLRLRTERADEMTHPDRWVMLAGVLAEQGDLDGAIAAGERAVAERAQGLPMLLVDPRLAALRQLGGLDGIEAVITRER